MEYPPINMEYIPLNMEFPKRGMKRKRPDYIQLFEKLKYNTYSLISANKIVKYSFIVQKSLTYLDLSLCELSKSKRRIKKIKYIGTYSWIKVKPAIITEEDCRKRLAESRYVLYIYHLDVSKGLEGSLRNPGLKTKQHACSEAVLTNMVEVNYNVHDYLLNRIISTAYKESENKVQIIYSVSKFMKAKLISQNDSIRNNGLTYLCFHCKDSNIIKEFLINMGFHGEHFFMVILHVFERVLQHAKRTGYDLYAQAPYMDPIHTAIRYEAFDKTICLFQYRSAPRFCEAAYNNIRVGHSLGVPEIELYMPVHNKRMSSERHLLIMEIISCYIRKMRESLKALQMLWRSISDPYISMDELSAVLLRVPNQNHVRSLSDFLQQITGEPVAEHCRPRKLKDFCRTAIRNILWKHNAPLPEVIDKLKMPPVLKVFLELES